MTAKRPLEGVSSRVQRPRGPTITGSRKAKINNRKANFDKWKSRLGRFIRGGHKWLLALGAGLAALAVFSANVSSFLGIQVRDLTHYFNAVCVSKTPINFDLPLGKSPIEVGQYVEAYGTHRWAKVERLWIFLFASDSAGQYVYYPYSRLQLDGNSWVANRIALGRNARDHPVDAEGSLYAVDLVLATTRADRDISDFIRAHKPTQGIPHLPGRAKVVKRVVVSRIC